MLEYTLGIHSWIIQYLLSSCFLWWGFQGKQQINQTFKKYGRPKIVTIWHCESTQNGCWCRGVRTALSVSLWWRGRESDGTGRRKTESFSHGFLLLKGYLRSILYHVEYMWKSFTTSSWVKDWMKENHFTLMFVVLRGFLSSLQVREVTWRLQRGHS